MKAKSKILVLTHTYLPGAKAGGPIRTLANLIELLGDEFKFLVVCSDRDMGSNVPYQGIEARRKITLGKGKVIYLSPEHRIKNLKSILADEECKIIYINSFFDFWFSILPVILISIFGLTSAQIVVAPRGEFATSALANRKFKKAIFLKLAAFLGLYKKVVWQATDSTEALAIKNVARNLGSEESTRIAIASDLVFFDFSKNLGVKIGGDQLNIIFLSRIVSIKNLEFALQIIGRTKRLVKFDIYGFLEDKDYWTHCKKIIENLPPNICASYCGEVEHDSVRPTISKYDIFFVPTKGENFGHVFVEALSSGVPILVSDQTPWRDLAKAGVGWDLSLSDASCFLEVIENFSTGAFDRTAMQRSCFAYATNLQNNALALNASRELFIHI